MWNLRHRGIIKQPPLSSKRCVAYDLLNFFNGGYIILGVEEKNGHLILPELTAKVPYDRVSFLNSVEKN